MTLYEIGEEMLACLDEDTGEVVDVERLSALEMERDKKISGVACWIKDLDAEAEALKKEKQALERRQKVAENKAESLRQYLSAYLNGETYKDSRVDIRYRRNKSLEIAEDLDISKLPKQYLRIKTEPDKTAIKEAINSGKTVKGCVIVEKTNMIIK